MSLGQAMAIIIKVFKDYAGKDGDAKTLSKSEVKELLNKEFGMKMEGASNKGDLDKMFKSLDANADGTVDFTEFVTLVAALTAILEGGL